MKTSKNRFGPRTHGARLLVALCVAALFCVAETPAHAQVPACGDGAVNQQSEQCDPPGSTCGRPAGTCDQDCLCQPLQPLCGDGTVNQASEQCDDGNAAAGDGCSSDCLVEGPIVHPCRHPCPSRIALAGRIDALELSVGFAPATPVDPAAEELSVRVANAGGTIATFLVPAGSLDQVGTRTFQVRDVTARLAGGVGRARVKLRPDGTVRLNLLAFGDLSAATSAGMTVEIRLGDDVATTAQAWVQRQHGWILNLN